MMKECILCGVEFETKGRTALYCPECKVIVKKQHDRERSAALLKEPMEETIPYSPKEGLEKIGKVVVQVERYNREHGTCLSYGKYVQLMGL